MGGLRSGQYAKAVFKERRALYCLAFLLAAVLAGGCGGNDNTSGKIKPTLAAIVSPTAALATPSPIAEPPTPTPTSTLEPTVLPTATQNLTQPVDECPKRTNNHLNIDKLSLQPGMTDATITEIDQNSIRIEFDGVEAIVRGRSGVLGIHGDLSNDQLDRLSLAIDAVLNEC